MHQFRQAYELDGTEHGQFGESPGTGRSAGRIHARPDRARARRSGSSRPRGTWRAASRRSTGLEAEVLPHPPQELAVPLRRATTPFVLSVGRLDRAKRIDLLLEAAGLEPAAGRRRGRRAGPGAARGARAPAGDACASPAASREEELADLYARCRAVYYAPVDEDFGMVPLEAFRSASRSSRRPTPAGRSTSSRPARPGCVVEPRGEALAAALALDRARGRSPRLRPRRQGARRSR